MIQVLSYLRAVDENWYRTELHALMDAPSLQPHLKVLLISWLADLPDPTESEWESVRRLLLSPANRPRMLRALHGKLGWWPYLRPGMNNRLQQPGEVVDGEWIPHLSSVVDDAQDDVIALVEPYFGRSRQWDDRVGRVLHAIGKWSSPAAVGLYDRWVRSQPDVSVNALYLLPEVAKGEPGEPEIVCARLRYVLDDLVRRVDTAVPTDSGVPGEGPLRQLLNNLRNEYSLIRALEIVSQRVPDRFVREMLPWVERIAAASTEGQDDAGDYRHDALAFGWYYRVDAFDERFIGILVGALQALARSNPDTFRRHAARLRLLPFVTAQRLIAVAYAASPEHYSEDALAFLLEDHRRLSLGDRDDYDSLKLIQALCAHLSPEQNAQLEEAILTYQPMINGNAQQVLRFRELAHLRLLSAMSPQHLTKSGRRRLQELERKYGEYPVPDKPFSMVVGTVQSPIEPEATEKMSNAQWLAAIAKYSGDTEHPDLLRGGVDQLANELARRTKEQPVLSHELAIRDVAPDVDTRYLDAMMRGLAEAGAPASLLFDVVRRFRHRHEPDFRRGAAWALRKRAGQSVPSDLLDLLEAWARGPALGDEDWWRRQDEQRAARPGMNYSEGDPYESYLNSVRGSALNALLQALHVEDTSEAREREWALLEWASRADSSALKAGAAGHLTNMLYADDERAVSIFEATLEGHPELLRSHLTHLFVYYALRRHYGRMRPYIRQLLDDEDAERRRVGARFACLAAFTHSEAEDLVFEVMAGDPEHRLGAANVYSANYRQPGLRAVCEVQLRKLLDDPEPRVRWEIGTCFGGLTDEDFEGVRQFLEAFGASRALGDYPGPCVEYVHKCTLLDPDWSLKFMGLVLKNPATGGGPFMSSDVELLVRLVIRIYDQHSGTTRQRALDTFNALLERFPRQTQSVLSEYERR